ncbi:MAG: D-alanyl-D-alanine carboxypeptidase [Alphaproteobacteria bacterium]|nr:D-alanyl-D-alanine carboxypeptidase [Alphaproteobacteria bacterium]MBL7098481.1 D-alanyl-D-alanine carboxypeptidase [Alphaproteobacteria bacterium]
MNLRLLSALFVLAFLAAVPARADIATTAEHGILVDYDSGQVLWAKDAFSPMPPASMSKLMTLELLFQRLKDGRVKLTDTFPVSERAWSTQGSKMFVEIHGNIPVEALIRGIIVDSGNDACMVVAEGIGGTMEGFVAMMNRRAKELGLKQAHFVNPDGLPDPPGQLMSTLDLATLARHIIQTYPQYYRYFSEQDFTWHNIHQHNRDTVLQKIPGADGLKTGHTDAAGYGITTSAVQNGRRLILVLNGLRYPDLEKTDSAHQDWVAGQRRGDEAARILGLAFREFRRYTLFKPGDVVGQAEVFAGGQSMVPLTVKEPVNITLQVDSRPNMKVAIRYNAPLRAPLEQGQPVATLVISAPDFPGMSVPLVAAQPVDGIGFFGRIAIGIKALFGGA